MRHITKYFSLSVALNLLLFLILGASLNFTHALSGSDFMAGRIIDDAIFNNSTSMSASQIQDFLNTKVPVCDTNGQQTLYDSAYGDTVTRAVYSSRRGVSTPFICLKDYKSDTSSISPESSICSGYVGKSQESAAQIIYNVAQSCGISPKVLLVTLQKEQSLVTDDWPWPTQYQKAMGAFCPDTSPCDSGYAGFFKQVYYGAERFKVYAANPTSFNYRAGRNNTIYFNPGPCQTYSSGTCTKYYGNKYDANGNSIPDITYCGSTTVYIENQATADLYIYTPYQPNTAALNNLYGTGDMCSAYGNRNFWRMFNDWFGRTTLDRPTSNSNWQFENLVGGTSSLSPTADTTGIQPKSITYNNKLYIFYYDATQKTLMLSYADTNGWHHELLDGTSTTNGRVIGDVGRATTALIYNNDLHIYYYDATNKGLRHGWYNDTNGWTFESLDGANGSVSNQISNVGMSNVVVEYSNGMHLFYYDAKNTNLRHAWYYPADGWKFENLEGDYGSISGYNADSGQNPDALVYGGTLQLFYYDVSNGNLRHAWSSPTQPWKFENLDGDQTAVSRNSANVGQDPTITMQGDTFQLFYYDVSNGNLRHAWSSPTQPWKFENLDGDLGSVLGNNDNTGSMSRTFSFKGVLYVFYRENSAGILKYAWADSGGWHIAPLDGNPYSVSGSQSNTGFWPTITSYGDSLQLYYFDNDQRALRHAFGTPYF